MVVLTGLEWPGLVSGTAPKQHALVGQFLAKLAMAGKIILGGMAYHFSMATLHAQTCAFLLTPNDTWSTVGVAPAGGQRGPGTRLGRFRNQATLASAGRRPWEVSFGQLGRTKMLGDVGPLKFHFCCFNPTNPTADWFYLAQIFTFSWFQRLSCNKRMLSISII